MTATELLVAIASMTCDGEEDDAGEPYEMAIDDAYETLSRIIREARSILRENQLVA